MHGRAHDQPQGVPRTRNAAANTAVADEMMDVDHTPPGNGDEIPVPDGPQTGKLASFCPACPQPGINLPEDWKDEPNRYLTHSLVAIFEISLCFRELFIRLGAVDGNFKADHMTPKNEDDDVHLTEGEGFMTAAGPYAEHLKDATARSPKYRKVRPRRGGARMAAG